MVAHRRSRRARQLLIALWLYATMAPACTAIALLDGDEEPQPRKSSPDLGVPGDADVGFENMGLDVQDGGFDSGLDTELEAGVDGGFVDTGVDIGVEDPLFAVGWPDSLPEDAPLRPNQHLAVRVSVEQAGVLESVGLRIRSGASDLRVRLGVYENNPRDLQDESDDQPGFAMLNLPSEPFVLQGDGTRIAEARAPAMTELETGLYWIALLLNQDAQVTSGRTTPVLLCLRLVPFETLNLSPFDATNCTGSTEFSIFMKLRETL